MGCSHSSDGRVEKKLFVWKIVGFTSLVEQKGPISTAFSMQGIIWNLFLDPTDTTSGDTCSEKHVSLFVQTNVSPANMLETKFKFIIIDQKFGKHAEREVSYTYQMTGQSSGVACMVPLETLKNLSAGFLQNDTIAVGIELIQFKKVPCISLERTIVIQKNKIRGSYSWFIKDFFQLYRPISEPFKVYGLNWRMKLKRGGARNKNYVYLYLILDESRYLLGSRGVIVDAVFSIKRQSAEDYAKRVRAVFSGRNACSGCVEFISLDELEDPSNKYLVNGACTIKASICILGSTIDRSSKGPIMQYLDP